MKEILGTYTSYNLWANKIILDLLENNSSLLDKEVKSSFTSLRKTAYHIWSAEEIWHKRLNGESPPSLPQPGNDFSEFSKQLSLRSQSFIDRVKEKDETHFQTLCSYKDTRGNSYSNPQWQMIMHCMNHSTYHRGQIITLLRELGLTTIPPTDLIVYIRVTGE